MERIERPDGPERDRPAPTTQTIILDRRDRGGRLARLVVPLLWIGLFLYLFGGGLGRDAGMPGRLAERYVAGDLTAPKVAVVAVDGLLLDGEAEHVIRQIRQARDDEQVRAVVLHVDSPGGTVSAADRIWREVELLKARKKPVVAAFAGIAASGGYYVAAPADHIIAEPTTTTGSIGVILEMPRVKGLLDKLGVEFDAITSGPWKDSGSPFRAMTPAERARWQELVDDAYGRFVAVVAQGRGLGRAAVAKAATGQVFTAREALDLKLINEIGYLDDAILHAQRLANLNAVRVVRYAKPQSPVEALLGIRAPDPRPGLQVDPDLLLRLQTPRLLFLAR